MDYVRFHVIYRNESGHDILLQMKSNLKGEFPCLIVKDKPGDKFHTMTKGNGQKPRFSSATITFDDGKVLSYSSKDKGRSLCNLSSYENPGGTGGDSVFYEFTITEEDYALAVMPSEE